MVEWFASFYDFARDADAASRPLECVCEPGDVLFVPSGWWHMALNVTECIAVTQNFVSRHNARKVLAFLDTKCENLVSGTTRDRRGGLADAFVAAARASGDARLTAALDAHEAEKARKAASRATTAPAQPRAPTFHSALTSLGALESRTSRFLGTYPVSARGIITPGTVPRLYQACGGTSRRARCNKERRASPLSSSFTRARPTCPSPRALSR